VHCDQFALGTKYDRRRVLEIFIAPEDGVEIGEHLGDILVQVGDAVYGLESGIALGSENFFGIAY
jgi:hypothetical protein